MLFSNAHYAYKSKQACCEYLFIEVEQFAPLNDLIVLKNRIIVQRKGGRLAYLLMATMRVHLMQN